MVLGFHSIFVRVTTIVSYAIKGTEIHRELIDTFVPANLEDLANFTNSSINVSFLITTTIDLNYEIFSLVDDHHEPVRKTSSLLP